MQETGAGVGWHRAWRKCTHGATIASRPGANDRSIDQSDVVSDSGDVNATLQQMTQELRDYVVRTRSVPKDFEEFIAKSEVRFPPPPEGKQYAIKGQAVVLVKR